MGRSFAAFIVVLITVYILSILPLHQLKQHEKSSVQTKQSAQVYQKTSRRWIDVNNENLLSPGDLPGYSGWARPSSTLASTVYVIDEHSSFESTIEMGQTFTFQVATNHSSGQRGGALFFVRAYGKSIITGTVKDLLNGTYEITIQPFDEGLHTVELVLTFSNHPDWGEFPVPEQAGYEGFLIPTFPRTINVVQSRSSIINSSSTGFGRPLCRAVDMFERNFESGLRFGRWVVSKKAMMLPYDNQSQYEAVDLTSYASGMNSVGFEMSYEPVNCRLLDIDSVRHEETLLKLVPLISAPLKPLHVIFIGDSNMMRQHNAFRKLYNGTKFWHSTMIGIRRGIIPRIKEVEETLHTLSSLNHTFFVFFNSGLHDTHELCGTKTREDRAEYINIPDEHFSCTDSYRKAVVRFVDLILKFPADRHVWQSSTAAWPKWGTYGIPWPISAMQLLPKAPDFVEHMNEIAWNILQANNVSSLDGFWLTLARPDHREVVMELDRVVANKLAHAGPEIYSVMVRQLVMIIFETIAPNYHTQF